MSFQSSSIDQDKNVEEILKIFEGGGEVLFARSHTGEQRVKVRYGLLNLRIKRYTVNYQTAMQIKDAISARIGMKPRFAHVQVKRDGF